MPTRSLLVVLLVSLVWRVPSLFDPPWVNDEGTYFAVAQAMARGYRLYAGIWENKPPALYLLYGAVYHLAGPSLLAVRLLAAVAALAIVILVALVVAPSAGRWPALAAAVLAGLLLGVPFLEGTTANAEIFLSAGTALAAYLVTVRAREIAGGLAGGIAVLFKAVAAFDVATVTIWLLLRGRLPYRYVISAAAVVVVACGVAWEAGILPSMLRDAVLYDLGYVGHANGRGFPWVLLVKVIALAVVTLALRRAPFPYLWLAYAVAGSLFSGRIFGHYFIQAVAPFSMSFGLLLAPRPDLARRLVPALPIFFVALAFISALAGEIRVASGTDDILARRLQYYVNFARYAVGAEPYATYRNQIDDHVSRNITIAAALRRLPPARLLVWGNVPWVYVLSGRLPATPYTSALRDPPVPGETAALRDALHQAHIIAVLIRPPAPPLGPAGGVLRTSYWKVRSIENGSVYVARDLRSRSVAK